MKTLRYSKPVSLDSLCEDISVYAPDEWENDTGPEGWYAVSDLDGIKAYFEQEADAFRWRLAEINRILNP